MKQVDSESGLRNSKPYITLGFTYDEGFAVAQRPKTLIN